jgi:hypothetical protein
MWGEAVRDDFTARPDKAQHEPVVTLLKLLTGPRHDLLVGAAPFHMPGREGANHLIEEVPGSRNAFERLQHPFVQVTVRVKPPHAGLPGKLVKPVIAADKLAGSVLVVFVVCENLGSWAEVNHTRRRLEAAHDAHVSFGSHRCTRMHG